MTIDEAIEDLIYDAQCNRADLDIEWAERNEQLAEWLEELKFVRRWKADVMESFCKYDASSFEEIVYNTRNKAIDDYIHTYLEWYEKQYDRFADDERIDMLKIAEQMKNGE